jgi:hypothetical protein
MTGREQDWTELEQYQRIFQQPFRGRLLLANGFPLWEGCGRDRITGATLA